MFPIVWIWWLDAGSQYLRSVAHMQFYWLNEASCWAFIFVFTFLKFPIFWPWCVDVCSQILLSEWGFVLNFHFCGKSCIPKQTFFCIYELPQGLRKRETKSCWQRCGYNALKWEVLYPWTDLLLHIRIALCFTKTRDEVMLAALRL